MVGMRITQVHSSDLGGGAEAVVLAHHQNMRGLGIDAKLIVARKHLEEAGVQQIPYVRGPKGFRRAARWLESVTGRQYIYEPSFRATIEALPAQADVVHVHSLHGGGGYAELAPLVDLANSVPTLLSLHDLWWLTGHCAQPQECERWRTGCGRCPDLKRTPAIPRDGTRANFNSKRRIASSANFHLIAPSEWVKARVAESPILAHLPVTVVFNPVDTDLCKPGERTSARRNLGLAEDKRVLLVVAQYLGSPFKGVDALLQELEADAVPDAQLVLVGRDADAVAARTRMPVTTFPFLSDRARMAELYRAADLLLMPSTVETFGMAAAEAMACGTPVIAFPAGGLGDVVGQDGGVVVQQGDMGGFIAAIRQVLDDDDLHRGLSAAAAVRAVREFSLSAHTQACLKTYKAHIAQFRTRRHESTSRDHDHQPVDVGRP